MANVHTCTLIVPALVLSGLLAAGATFAAEAASQEAGAAALPVRGLHLSGPAKKDLPAVLEFIRQSLPKEGINTLVMEFGYGFDYQSQPGFADPAALGKAEVGQIAAACREVGIELIPQLNCLGHQSWAAHTDKLLTKHPEFDETPGKNPGNKDIYCRSYCPLHPDLHNVLFDLIDELAKACQAKSFHVGMDEVFILADGDCPRCKGKDPADLFAGEVKALHDHLKEIGCRTWMWGDRFLDGKATGIGKWEASLNGTQAAIDKVPTDIVICDWHYGKAPKTAAVFAAKGFPVMESPWRDSAVALAELAEIRSLRAGSDAKAAAGARGMLQTTWCGPAQFLEAYKAQAGGAAPAKGPPAESAACFRALCKAMRESK